MSSPHRRQVVAALAVVVPLVVIVSLFVLYRIWSGPSIQTSVSKGQKHYQPLIDALESYRKSNGSYPPKLEQLVTEGFIAQIPSTPIVSNAREHGPYYTVNETRDAFTLTFDYHLKRQLFLGDTTYAEWDSTKRRWDMSGPGY